MPDETTTPSVPTWDDYFLGIASAVAARAKCTRRRLSLIHI